jgi:ribosomal protein L7Ae-like RNA K-turn-binding protein
MERPAPAEAFLRVLGLAARAGAIVPGTERVREAVRAGKALFVVVAADVSENSGDKLVPLLTSRGVRHVVRYDRLELGAAVGKSPLAAIAVTDPSLAGRLAELAGTGE